MAILRSSIIGLIVLGAAVRGRAIWDSPVRRPQALHQTRDRVLQLLRASDDIFELNTSTVDATRIAKLKSLLDQHVTRIQLQRWDPMAVVVMQAGPDGQPGVAGIDDDRNQIVDDRSELGATHSDDVCLVQRHDQQDDASLVLQYGAFVPTAPAERRGESPQPMRVFVFGESAGHDRWSFLIEGDELGVRE